MASIQYQVASVLARDTLMNFDEFSQLLSAGPKHVMGYLDYVWHRIKMSFESEGIEATDIGKEITPMSFKAYLYAPNDECKYYGVELPDYEYPDATSKYIVIADEPRYYTLEYSRHVINNAPCFVIGEWVLVNGVIEHKNLGAVDEVRDIWHFIGLVRELENSPKH